jgi:hypothetical protein
MHFDTTLAPGFVLSMADTCATVDASGALAPLPLPIVNAYRHPRPSDTVSDTGET